MKKPPPYICNLVSAIANRSDGSQNISFSMQYVGISNNICISYDTIFSGDSCLHASTFDVIEEKSFFKDQFEEIFISYAEENSAKFVKIKSVSDIPNCWKLAGFVDHEMTILTWDVSIPGKVILKIRSKATFRRHPFGEFAGSYMIPRFPKSDGGKANPLCLAGIAIKCDTVSERKLSDVIQTNLEAMELAISAPVPKIVFVQGEPGSGKDTYANAIHNGSRINKGRDYKRSAIARSVAGMDLAQFRRTVFGEERDGVLIKGLIDEAGSNTLFLDEFDKIKSGEEGVYAELLRVWEAKEYVPVGARAVQKADKVNWVVAGAFTSQRTTADLPPDIWSRFNAQIAIQTPLSSPSVLPADRTNYIHALIFGFMLGLGIGKLGLKKKDGEDPPIDKSMDCLRKPESRQHAVIAYILFGTISNVPSKEKVARNGTDGTPIQPSSLLCGIAMALAKYLGQYWTLTIFQNANGGDEYRSHTINSATDGAEFKVEITPHEDQRLTARFPGHFRPVAYCVPNFAVKKEPDPDRLPQSIDKNDFVTGLDNSDNTVSEEKLDRIFNSKSATLMVQFDSVRTIRQACQVVFERIFEWELGAAATGVTKDNTTPKEIFVRKILNEAFSTVDLARNGNSLAQVLSGKEVENFRLNAAIEPLVKKIASVISDQAG